MIPGVEEGLAPSGAGYNTSHVQVLFHDRGAVANRGTLGQDQPMRSEGLAGGGYDNNWHGGSEKVWEPQRSSANHYVNGRRLQKNVS